jgi:hypothetical protein
MNVHDGIPFIKITFVDKRSDFFNPLQISSMHDLTEKECIDRKTKFPAVKIIFNNGKDQVIGNFSGAELVELINKTMISWKDKLADKALLGESN